MSHTKATIQEVKTSTSVAALKVSLPVFLGTVVFLGLLISVLLCGIAWQTSALAASIVPVAPNPHAALERRVHKVVRGYPIEVMAPYIAGQDKTTAAFLVGIGKKESNWGKRVPRDAAGVDCYNYWGYRGEGSRGIEMGHGCFGSPEEAIGIVGGRLDTLIQEYKFRTPKEMIVWKCGWSCDGHSPQSVKKWISDVGFYFDKVNDKQSL